MIMGNMKRKSSLGTKISIMVLFMVVFSAASVGLYGYIIIRNDSINRNAKQAQAIAQMAANNIDGNELKRIFSSNQKTQYWHSVKSYLDDMKTITDVQYLYIIDGQEAHPTYFAEGEKSGDDPTQLGDLGQVEEPNAFAAEAYETVRTGSPTTTNIYYSEGYGRMVSGFAAIIDRTGAPVGVVGADISVSEVLAVSRGMGISIVIAVVMFSFIFTMIAVWYIRKTVSKPLTLITRAADDIADGSLNINFGTVYSSSNEIGKLNQTLSKMQRNLYLLIGDIEKMTDIHRLGDYEFKLDENQYTGAYRDVITGVNGMTCMYVENFLELLDVLQKIGKGDFDVQVKKYPGKLGYGNEVFDELKNNFENINREITDLAETAANGNLSARVKRDGYQGGWDKMAANINSLMVAIVTPITEATGVLSEVAKGNLRTKMIGNYGGDFRRLKASINVTIDAISGYVKEINKALSYIAEYDLSYTITKDFRGDFSGIKESIEFIIEKLNDMLSSVYSVSETVKTGSKQISDANRSLSEQTNSQTEVVNKLTTVVTDITNQTQLNVKTATDADTLSSITKQNATDGDREMQNMLDSMNLIKESSNNIANIINVIQDIALQINLLSLNAAVEAARAGQHGKGFAVVAEEVGNLASRSQKAVKDTKVLINDTVNRINDGSKTAESASEALQRIIENVTEVSNLVSNISVVSNEQTKTVQGVSVSAEMISNSTHLNTLSTQVVSTTVQELSEQSDLLNMMLDRFKRKEQSDNPEVSDSTL